MTQHANLLSPLLHGAVAEHIFSPRHQVAEMVRFEVALTFALEEAGVAPLGSGCACEQATRGFPDENALDAIAAAAAQDGNLAIPFVRLLTTFVGSRAGDVSDFIHYGATSQDLLDTTLVLQLADACEFVASMLERIIVRLIELTETHRTGLLPGRTWLQQGPPIMFSLKTAQWLSAMLRHRDRLAAARQRVLVLQFGGAVGTLASLGPNGPKVTRALAHRLGLAVPDIPWHTQRDSIAELAAVLALVNGTLGKIGRDLSLMLQNEVSEVALAAPEGTGGSSTMPHKRNPVSLAVVLSAAVRAPGLAATMFSAMVQEHERGLGGWHAEWETLPDLARITCGALLAMAQALDLEVQGKAMQRNLELLNGVTLAESVSILLSPAMGRPAAHRLLESACRVALERNVTLLSVLTEDAAIAQHVSREVLAQALSPETYLGSAQLYINQVLASAAQSRRKEEPDAMD